METQCSPQGGGEDSTLQRRLCAHFFSGWCCFLPRFFFFVGGVDVLLWCCLPSPPLPTFGWCCFSSVGGAVSPPPRGLFSPFLLGGAAFLPMYICRIWFLLHRQSFIHDVSSADPLGLRALCLCVLCSDAIVLHHCLKKCVTAHQNHTEFISVSSIYTHIIKFFFFRNFLQSMKQMTVRKESDGKRRKRGVGWHVKYG